MPLLGAAMLCLVKIASVAFSNGGGKQGFGFGTLPVMPLDWRLWKWMKAKAHGNPVSTGLGHML